MIALNIAGVQIRIQGKIDEITLAMTMALKPVWSQNKLAHIDHIYPTSHNAASICVY